MTRERKDRRGPEARRRGVRGGPEPSRPGSAAGPLLDAQRSAGNAAVREMLSSGRGPGPVVQRSPTPIADAMVRMTGEGSLASRWSDVVSALKRLEKGFDETRVVDYRHVKSLGAKCASWLAKNEQNPEKQKQADDHKRVWAMNLKGACEAFVREFKVEVQRLHAMMGQYAAVFGRSEAMLSLTAEEGEREIIKKNYRRLDLVVEGLSRKDIHRLMKGRESVQALADLAGAHSVRGPSWAGVDAAFQTLRMGLGQMEQVSVNMFRKWFV